MPITLASPVYDYIQWTGSNSAAVEIFCRLQDKSYFEVCDPAWGTEWPGQLIQSFRGSSTTPVFYNDFILKDTVTGELMPLTAAAFNARQRIV